MIDRDGFLRNLHQSGLLTADELGRVMPRLPQTTRGRAVARSLVEMGLLTRFQAERLLAGVTGGFLLGQYRILDLLGEGGMGKVYKAVHETMNREVALKLLAPQLVKTARARDLFQREVRAAARLIHPNIVTAFDANQIGDRHFLVMEYVDGPNLDQLVRERGPLPVGLACELIRQAAVGLQYAHDMGMVHRDIKPANLLVHLAGKNKDLVVKILDFGLARLHGGGDDLPPPPGSRTVMGTPDYLSPEQGDGKQDVDIRSDLYSLGCTFYFLLTARPPFLGGTSLEKLDRHKDDEPEPVEAGIPLMPSGVPSIVRRLMAKYPPHRFQTPAEVVTALAAYAGPAASPWEGASRPDSGSGLVSLPSTGDINLDKTATTGTLTPDLGLTPASHLGLTAAELANLSDPNRLNGLLLWAAAIVLGIGVTAGLLTLLLR